MSFFFFSSRRRHTRCSRDWSSDVCSSDLPVGPHSYLAVCVNNRYALSSKAGHAQGLPNGRVDFGADDDVDGRRAKHSILIDVPACPLEESVPSSNQRSEVRHGGAGHQATFTIGGQSKGFADPLKNYIFKLGGDRRHDAQSGVLIPCGWL